MIGGYRASPGVVNGALVDGEIRRLDWVLRGGTWLIVVSGALVMVTWFLGHHTGRFASFIDVAGPLWVLQAVVVALYMGSPRGQHLRQTLWIYLFGAVMISGGVALIALADGGASSPFLTPLVFAACFYAFVLPRRGSIPSLVLIVGSAVLVDVLDGHPTTVGSGATVVMIAIAGALGDIARIAFREATREIAVQSRTDSLTRCLNRFGFEERVEAELSRAERKNMPLSLLLLDLDDFKGVNDRLGHAAGDAMLSAVGRGLRSALRTSDAAARLGGDEFAILLPDTDAAEARDAAQRVAVLLAPHAGASIGVATLPDDGAEIDALLHVADQRLYRVKRERSALR
jgi:diguanylate cyclase (GGDEF)-like protein